MANCPSCHRYFAKKDLAIDHINKYHGRELDEKNVTAAQWLYMSTHNGDFHGKCMICGNPTDWNSRTMKPFKLCNNPKCRAKMKADYDKNLQQKLHLTQTELMSNMDHQKEMLSNRKISGRYKFADGGEVEYVAKLELSFLQFCDKILDMRSQEFMPSPDVFTYFDPKDGKDHQYIPDYYLPGYNLLVEIKDKGNTNPAFLAETRYKVALKDDAMRKQSKYHYIRISGTSYGPLMELLYKITHGEDKKDPDRKNIVVISEAVNVEPTEPTHEPMLMTCYYPNNQLKALAITQNLKDWYVSDLDLEEVYPAVITNPVFDNTMYRLFRFNGETERMAALTDYLKAKALNPGQSGDWDLMELMKAGRIRFDDMNGNSNNDTHESDFDMTDVGYNKAADKREEEDSE